MYDKLWLIPFFPLLGSIINGLLGKRFIKNEKVIGGIATGAVFLSFLVSCKYFYQLLGDSVKIHETVVASWMSVGNLQVDWGFLLDPLSAVMLMVVCGVGSLIHLYSIGYMHGEEGYYRFFSYLNQSMNDLVRIQFLVHVPYIFQGISGYTKFRETNDVRPFLCCFQGKKTNPVKVSFHLAGLSIHTNSSNLQIIHKG
jgi:hypothetical protein